MAMPAEQIEHTQRGSAQFRRRGSATIAASRPCVRPMCRPHSVTPISTATTLLPSASNEIGEDQDSKAAVTTR